MARRAWLVAMVFVFGLTFAGRAFPGKAPSISSISPTSGPVATSVTINGSNFGASQGTSSVTFNGFAAATTSWSTSKIVATVPPNATTGPVVVTVGGQASNGVTFTVTPGISSLSPSSGLVGTLVTVSGSSFGSTQGSSTITFNAIKATPNNWSSSSIIAAVPSAATSGPVAVTVGGVASNGVTFTVTPNIRSLSPQSGPVGTSATITGSGFGATQGSSTVTFNGTSGTATSWNSTGITATVPSGATTGLVVVKVGGVSSNGMTFTVGTGTIAGKITRSSDGTAVAGATVQALQYNVVKASASTASDGTYSMPNLPSGVFDVRASATGLATAVQAGNAVNPGTTATVNLALASPATVSGKVTQSDAITAISGASVTIFQGTTAVSSASTDSTGGYTISTISPGTFIVQAAATGYQTQSQTGITVVAGNTTTANFSLNPAPIAYAYDDLGRLVGVTDQSGQTATYSYDPVGNLLSISRGNSSSVSITGFTPSAGPVGAQVTVYGTDFSPVPSQDSLQFNGTSATIVSATANQIVTSVPSSATTGPITVTAPAGSATSATPFTVSATLGPPTIAGFTPGIATPGTPVTVNGSNFLTPASNNKLKFNLTSATISSVNSGSISSSVPSGAGSGKISIATAYGSALSTADFFIPPAPYTASSVGFTGRVALGQSITVTLNTPNTIGLVVFDATAGHSMYFTTSNVSILLSQVSLLDPYGTPLSPDLGAPCSISSPGGNSCRATALPVTGTYTLLVAPQSGSTGSMTLNLYSVVDFTGVITAGGGPVNINLTTPGQKAVLSFSGSANQQVAVSVVNGNFTMSGSTQVVIYTPDGTGLAYSPIIGAVGFIGAQTLPVNGTYTIILDPKGSTGSCALTLLNVPSTSATTVTLDGTPVTVFFTTSVQSNQLTFAGTTGQRINLSSVVSGSASLNVVINNPDGSPLLSSGSGPGLTGLVTLPQSGTYFLTISTQSPFTGSASLALYNVPADASGTIGVGGSPVTELFSAPGQNAQLTFSGTGGQRISLLASFCGVILTLVGPAPATNTIGTSNCGFIDALNLPSAGAYTISVNAQNQTGSLTLTLYQVPADVTGTTSPNGSPFTATITTPGQNESLTFSGNAQQVVSVVANWPLNSLYTLSIYNNADGSLVGSANGGPLRSTLPTTGTYKIVFDPQGPFTGTETVTLYSVIDITGTITINGPAVTVNFTTPGQRARLTFSGSANQKVTVHTSPDSTLNCYSMVLLQSNGTTVNSYSACGPLPSFQQSTLPIADTFTILLDVGFSTGTMSVTLTGP